MRPLRIAKLRAVYRQLYCRPTVPGRTLPDLPISRIQSFIQKPCFELKSGEMPVLTVPDNLGTIQGLRRFGRTVLELSDFRVNRGRICPLSLVP